MNNGIVEGESMNIINLRKNLRRSKASRRVADRRVVPYEFGSPEWIENIQKNYLAWPKTNRRKTERRASDRRSPDRRSQQAAEQQIRAGKKYSRILLTSEERKLIEDLYLSDI